jgi:hypothetical protein
MGAISLSKVFDRQFNKGKKRCDQPQVVMPEVAPAAIRHLRARPGSKIPDKRLMALSGMTVISNRIGVGCSFR